MNPYLLLVEDEQDLGNVVRQYLELMSFKVDHVQDAETAQRHVLADPRRYALLIIDVNLPGRNGFELANDLVHLGLSIPFLFLTARQEKEDRIRGLKLGADDYITKPFDIDELVLRIRNILRRPTAAVAVTGPLQIGNFQFAPESLLLSTRGASFTLTPREADLLVYLLRHANKVVRREQILQDVWGNTDYFSGRSLDVFISRLRKYLSASDQVSIDNIYGVGFVFKLLP